MTDKDTAKQNLEGHSLCLCKDGKILTSDKRGIAPLMDFITLGADLNGYSAADIIVGKAAAFLMVKCGIKEVYAKVLSQAGKEVFDAFGINYEYQTLTKKIINRDGTDVCPMEKAVTSVTDPEQAYEILYKTFKSLSAKL